MGVITCSYRWNGHALVTISENPWNKEESTSIVHKFIKYGYPFHIEANVRHFKTPLIFIIKTFEARRRFRQYVTGVTGNIFCIYRNSGKARILISEKPWVKEEGMPIERRYVKYGKTFHIVGRVTNFRRPRLYLKIIHDCVLNNHLYRKMILEQIPMNYVTRTKQLMDYFNMGYIDLARSHRQIVISSRSKSV
uniref:DNA-directed RNA polymerase n=1 Tax=Strongyloides papillosus TaxID=174720 RepID=A0A0N5CFK7_STREA